MKTEDLIASLAAEPAPIPTATLERRAGLGVVLGAVGTVALFLALLGPRPDLGLAMADPVVLAKTLLPLLLGVFASLLVMRSARPAVPAGLPAILVWLVPATVAGLFLWAVATTEPSQRAALFWGHSTLICLPSIPMLSLPILAGLIAALRKGAPTRPARCGALAGLVAAGLATTAYSLFCTEDSPLFYAVWYSVAICVAALIGAVAGRYFLRW